MSLLCVVTSVAQQGRGVDKIDDVDLTSPEKLVRGTVQGAGIALESTVDPARYFVGPSDVIAVTMEISQPMSVVLTVTPEGTLLIPTIGEVKVSDMTLVEVKKTVLNEIKKKYIGSRAGVTLVRPRPIVVTVVGNVLNPGLYTLTAVDRANRAIDEANKALRTQTQEDIVNMLNRMSTRNIVLRHKDSKQERVDITKFLATRDDGLNPYLREGDVVIVPRRDREKNVFGVYGEVNSPGRYEFVQGDSLLDALQIGQGFTRLARKDSICFSRLNEEGTALKEWAVNFDSIRAGKSPNLELEPGDRIVVKPRLDLREDYTVTIRGEVRYPGTYPITRNRSRLSEVILAAGGFTDFASLRSAELLRRSIRPEDIQLERLESLRGGVSPEDSTYYYVETNLRIQKEIVNVDFEGLFSRHDSTQDVALQNYDDIVVPSIHRTIYVFGQVVSPGHIAFIKGEPAEYYVHKAGGFTDRARAGDVKIVKAKTRQWLSPDETTIEEGDYVWVPKVPDHTFSYYMNIVGQTASVVSVAVSIVLLVIQINK